MAYMHVCPKCRSFFKAKSTGKDLKCPKCSYQYLLDLKMDDEAWGTLNSVEKKIVIKARMSEEGLLDMMGAQKAPAAAKSESGETGAAGPGSPAAKKVVKKVVKKRVVKKVVKKPAALAGAEAPETVYKEETGSAGGTEPVKPEVKPAENTEETKQEVNDSPTGQSWEDEITTKYKVGILADSSDASKPDSKRMSTGHPESPDVEVGGREEEIKEENKASSGAAGILAAFLKGGKDKKEEEKEPSKPPKVKLNKKYVAIVAGTMGALLLYLLTVTFVVPTFRIKSELPILQTADTGDTVQFGKYKGQREWTVLDRKGTKLLCISNYAIYGRPYYDEGWNDSPLRKWLNSVYINSSFNVFERLRLTSTKEIQEEFPDYSRNMGTDEPDKVFLITEGELLDYLKAHKEAVMNVNDGEIRVVCWIETR